MRESTQDSVLWEKNTKALRNPKALAMSVYLYENAYLCFKMNIMLQVSRKAALSRRSDTNS